jgi:hypothetical protein
MKVLQRIDYYNNCVNKLIINALLPFKRRSNAIRKPSPIQFPTAFGQTTYTDSSKNFRSQVLNTSTAKYYLQGNLQVLLTILNNLWNTIYVHNNENLHLKHFGIIVIPGVLFFKNS